MYVIVKGISRPIVIIFSQAGFPIRSGELMSINYEPELDNLIKVNSTPAKVASISYQEAKTNRTELAPVSDKSNRLLTAFDAFLEKWVKVISPTFDLNAEEKMEEEYEEEVHQGGEYVPPPRPRNPLEVITGGPMQHEWMDSARHLFAYKNEYSAGLFMANETIKNMNRGNRKFFVGHVSGLLYDLCSIILFIFVSPLFHPNSICN